MQQMISVGFSQISPLVSMAAHATFGILTPYQDEYNDAVKQLKELLRGMNQRLSSGNRSWLVGEQCTLADIYLAGVLMTAF